MKNNTQIENQAQLEKVRHSISHLMSMAIIELYPKTGLGVGPFIENGFYQDYDLSEPISEEILPKLEKRIKELIKQDIKFEQHAMDFKEALKEYKHDPYKTEMIENLKKDGEKNVSFYKSDWFENLCKGPHVKSTKEIDPRAFKLTSIAGAYWRGDEKNKMLTRIYGVAFESKNKLNDYLKMVEEAKKRDHRKIGKDLDLFTFSETVGKGLPLWTEKGAVIKRELENFIINEELKRGYKHVVTPDMARVALYKKSGHYPYYKDSMYPPIKLDEEEFMLRPMACPHHFELYLSKPRSYRDLPLRIAELAKLYRYEKSGELTGLMRVRNFCLADSHIICADSKQAKDEINNVLNLIEYVAGVFGLKSGKDYSYRFSLGDRKNDKKYYKDNKAWDSAEKNLKAVLDKRKSKYVIAPDEAAFYGPKVDIQMKNVMGKEDTAFTVQYDFVMPKRFNLTYTNKKGDNQEAIVIHRSSIGAIERSVAFLIEHFAGNFPLWLCPIQVKIISVGSDHKKFCQKLANKLIAEGLRVETDLINETVGKKIRNASKEKIPYTLVIGDKELKSLPAGRQGDKLAVRVRGEEKLLEIDYAKFVKKLKKLISEKSLGL